MANEWTIIELLGNAGNPVRFACADGTGIAKGTAMTHSDNRTVVAHSAENESFAGVAAHEKVASDGSTSIALYTCGIFECTDNGWDVTLGKRAKLYNAANAIGEAAATNLLKQTAGIIIWSDSPKCAVLIGSGL